MKKHILLSFLLLALPVLVFPVTEEGITIAKISMTPVPFNERRDPAADSPYNAFDGDIKTAALYSDFSLEFSKPVIIDQLKIINGNSSVKDVFKRDNRERDIEITLYTVAYKPDKKAGKKAGKSKAVQPKKPEKKVPEKDKDTKSKTGQDKSDKEKTDKEKEEKEIKKTEIPEKVVIGDEYDTIYSTMRDEVSLYFTASEQVIEPVNKSENVKADETENETKKETKKTEKKPVKVISAKKKTPEKKKTETKIKETKKPEKKKEAKPSASKDKTSSKKKEQSSNDNIIEITDSKKSVSKTSIPAAEDKKNSETAKDVKTESTTKAGADTETKKSLAADEKPVKGNTVKTENKKPGPQSNKTAAKKTAKKTDAGKPPVKKEPVKNEADKSRIEIVDSKSKKDEKKPAEDKKTVKTEMKKKEDSVVKTQSDKKIEPVKEAKKDTGKNDKKPVADKKPVEDVKVNKMTGVVRIENDKDGRVLVYSTLKDSMALQSVDLKGEYAVTKIDFRTRDDEYYSGTMPDRSGITEISLFSKGKKLSIQGIDALKKSYVERYTQKLKDSLTDETFIMYENNEVVLRMKFRKDGRMEFFDRFKCSRKGDADCTSLSMPDMWKVSEGKLLMRYHTLWRVWKYELDSQNDMLSDNEEPLPPRWMKIYFKSDSGYTDQYLELYRSEKGIWAE